MRQINAAQLPRRDSLEAAGRGGSPGQKRRGQSTHALRARARGVSEQGASAPQQHIRLVKVPQLPTAEAGGGQDERRVRALSERRRTLGAPVAGGELQEERLRLAGPQRQEEADGAAERPVSVSHPARGSAPRCAAPRAKRLCKSSGAATEAGQTTPGCFVERAARP